MSTNSLFRQQIIDRKRNQNYGSVSINTPIRFTLLTVGMTAIVLAILLFLVFGEFSEKYVVKGYLNSSKGEVRVYPNKNGVITHSYIHQGDKVSKGDKLFLIDTSYKEHGVHGYDEMLGQLKKNKKLIDNEIVYKRNQLQAIKKLLVHQYISKNAYHQMQTGLLELKNKRNLVDMEIIKYRQEKSYVIWAPIDGVVSSIIFQEGQYTNMAKPLAKVLPHHAELVAALFIPVKHSGFLQKKNKLIIRYDAYPYERFGFARGVIKEISQSSLTDKEEDNPITIGQPYYKAIAMLDKQFVLVYGKKRKIHAGMTITAVVVGTKRKLWQWILEPVYSFYGDVFV